MVVMRDVFRVTLGGIQTVGTVRASLCDMLGKGWDVDWKVWRDKKDIVILQNNPLVREFTLPVYKVVRDE